MEKNSSSTVAKHQKYRIGRSPPLQFATPGRHTAAEDIVAARKRQVQENIIHCNLARFVGSVRAASY